MVRRKFRMFIFFHRLYGCRSSWLSLCDSCWSLGVHLLETPPGIAHTMIVA
jgi:hypothetical protein